MIYYDRLYKTKGIRRLEHFAKPRVLDAKAFEFPVGSVLHWWQVDSEPIYFKNDYGYLEQVNKCLVKSIYNEDEESMEGKVTKRSFIINSYISDNSKLCKNFKFLKYNQDYIVPDKTLYIYNYGAVNARYKYPKQPLLNYLMFNNTYKQVMLNLFNEPNRRSFLLIELPNTLFTRRDLERYSRRMINTYMDFFPTYKHFTFLDLWKFLNPLTINDSILGKLPKEKYKFVDLLINIDNKLLLLNLEFLASLVEEYKIESNIKPRPARLIQKLFYVMLTEFINTPAMNDSELIELENKLDNGEANVETNNDGEVIKVKNDSESNVVKDAKTTLIEKAKALKDKIFNSAEKHTLPTKNSFADTNNFNVTKLENDTDEDEEDWEESINELTEELEAENNIDSELEINDVNEINEEIMQDEVPSILEKQQLEAEFDLDFDYEIPSIEEIEEDLYKYDNVLNKVNHMKDSKLLSKSDVKRFNEIIDKSINNKDPFGGNDTIKDMLDESKDDYKILDNEIEITDNSTILDKTYNKNIINTVRSKYIKEQYRKDMIRSIYALQNNNFIIENVTVNNKSSIIGKSEEYKITIRTLDKKIHTVVFNLPYIEEDGTFKHGGNRYIMRWQRNSLPIRKLGPTTVKLSTYYGNLFINKANKKKDDVGYYLFKQLVKTSEINKNIKDIVMIPVVNENIKLPLDYSHFSRYIKGFIFNNMVFSFDYYNRIQLFDNFKIEDIKDLEQNKYILVGKEGSKPILIDFNNNLVVKEGNKYSSIGDFYSLLNINRVYTPIEHTTVKIFKEEVPVVLLLSYYYGLNNLFKILKTKFSFIDVNKRSPSGDKSYTIKFKDKKLVIEKDNGLGDMILGGLLDLNKITPEVTFKTMNNKNDFMVLYNKLNYGLLYINEIKNLETMFVDPISLTILKEMKYPLNFKGLLLKANELLLDDKHTNTNNLKDMCIRGYERLCGMVYTELVKAIRDYENKSAYSRSKIVINPFILYNKINEDSTTVLVDDLNPMSAIKQTEDVSYLGAQGFNKESMSKDTRIYNESEIGIISEAAKDSSDVGITAYMSANPKLADNRGLVGDYNKDDGIPSVFSTTMLLMPFSGTDDTKRLNFSSIMASHIVPVNNMRVPYVRTGYESIISVRADSKYVISAEDDGIVTKVDKSKVIVNYNKLGSKTYKIRSWTSKEESESCYTHIMVSNVKEKDKFIKDDTLIYDSSFFEPDIFNPKRVIYKQGDLVTVALAEDSNTYEDSCSLAKRMNKRLGTSVTKVKSIVVDKNDNIVNLKPVGSKLVPSDVLFSVVDDIITTDKLDAKTLSILKDLKSKSPKAKLKGTLEKIEVRYNCKLKEMSKTLQALAMASDKELEANLGYNGDVSDGGYSIKGKPLLTDEVEIKIYISVDTKMGIGDKAIFGNQLKCTVGEIFDNNITALDGTEIDATFSYRAISARIVNSPILIGTTSMCLEQLTKKVIDMYFK